MIANAKLFWIVELCAVFCVISAQERPRNVMNNINKLDMDANEVFSSEEKVRGRLKKSKGSNTDGRLMDSDHLSFNLGLPTAEQSFQVLHNPGIAPAAYSSMGDTHQALSQQKPEIGDRPCDIMPNAYAEADETEQRRQDLRILVQHLYVAQARVQLEATEIRKAQAVASAAQAQLEDAANQVRAVTATLHTAQQEVAASAIRAQIAQLQLAAHDQLLFAARQDVDALSSQMVGLQAAEGIVQPKLTVDLHALLDKLKQPLQHNDNPTPVPAIVGSVLVAQQQQFQMQHPQGQAQGQAQGQGQGQPQGQAQSQSQGHGPIYRQPRMSENSWNGVSDILPKEKSSHNLQYC